MTAPESAVDALAMALHGIGWLDTGYTYETDQKNAADILANLPPRWHLVHEEDLARRMFDNQWNYQAGELLRFDDMTGDERESWMSKARRLLDQDGGGEVTAEGERE